MKKRLLYLILPIVTLILELLPYGAVCNFARPATNGSIGHFRELYSYFDLLPFGYANFAPLITAVLSCVIVLSVAIYCLIGKINWAVAAKNLLYVTTAISLGPLILGIRFFSVVGALVTVSLIAELILIRKHIRITEKDQA